MTNFNGITPKAIELLSENRFNDSKAFYEEHKDCLLYTSDAADE
mgnify:CR=1 FL=1